MIPNYSLKLMVQNITTRKNVQGSTFVLIIEKHIYNFSLNYIVWDCRYLLIAQFVKNIFPKGGGDFFQQFVIFNY